MAVKGKTTIDHGEIRRWAERRGGYPTVVSSTHGGDRGLIRLAFPNVRPPDDAELEPISWDEWFDQFETNRLALLIEETTSDGRESRFNKFVSR